ncbi:MULTISPECIES: universal stress protein [Salipiger]|jgi:nucleotide-binding universal stress UspA family protein|uniref:Universal stress family protein n=1 Tax=Salipiger profundus TaxID=1229727 RepID=A0A1U7D5T7_9RHOB|nr:MULTISPECIES: universal stress protein [Salipiger]APX23511.1 universal stress family protein [Salipiger profundus]GGA20774.1 universal stress protein [Salipiger profundus]SFC79547.1 Universal stress protein family protein [Salipiger profundus]
MGYKTILTVVTDDALAQSTVEHAAAVAAGWDAHLDVLCFGVDRTQTGYYYAGANAMVLQETITRATADAEALAVKVRGLLARTDARWAVEEGVAQLADIGRHVASRARFADLVVLPKPYGKDHGVELEPVTEGALFEGQTPVLVVPDKVSPVAKPSRVVIGWNESNEALRSVRAAMPLLQSADNVHVVVIDPPQHGPNRSDPGGALSQYLARHGVKPEIDVLSKTMPRVSDVLCRHVQDLDADLVVMGAYGHSRFREAILGGATRNMLENAEVPVLLAH